jgi:hypothetical protein
MAMWEFFGPRRRQVIGPTVRWPGNLGMVVVDTILVRILFPITAVGLALAAEERGEAAYADLLTWTEAIRATVRSHAWDLEELMPWAQLGAAGIANAGEPEATVLEEALRSCFDSFPTLADLPDRCDATLLVLVRHRRKLAVQGDDRGVCFALTEIEYRSGERADSGGIRDGIADRGIRDAGKLRQELRPALADERCQLGERRRTHLQLEAHVQAGLSRGSFRWDDGRQARSGDGLDKMSATDVSRVAHSGVELRNSLGMRTTAVLLISKGWNLSIETG